MRWYKQSIFSGAEGQLETLRHADEIGDGLSGHLVHHAAAVHFHCDFAGAEVVRDLLVEAPRHDALQHLTLAWTALYDEQKVVIGSVYTAQGLSYTEQNPKISCDELIFQFKGVIENIWTRESINRRRLVLAATYVSCLPLFTICLIAVVQAIQCGGKPAKRRVAS